MVMGAYVYILECADGKYYTGTTRTSLEQRITEHNAGKYGGWTLHRRPVKLVFYEEFPRIEDAISAEKQIKGWRREKKAALITRKYNRLKKLSKNNQTSSFDKLRMRKN